MTEPHEPEDPTRAEGEHPSSGDSTDWTSSPAEPPTEPGWARTDEPAPAAAPRQRWWRSHRVRVGAAGVLAALVLLGGGFGAGYAVADASAPAAATHVTAEKGHARKGAAGAKKKRGQQQQQQQQQQPGTAPQPGTLPG